MPKTKTEDDKNSLLDDLDNLDQDPPKDDTAGTDDDPPPADDTDNDPPADDTAGTDDVPPENVVDMFVNGDMDAVKQVIQDKVVSVVSDVVNGPLDNDDAPASTDNDDPPPAED